MLSIVVIALLPTDRGLALFYGGPHFVSGIKLQNEPDTRKRKLIRYASAIKTYSISTALFCHSLFSCLFCSAFQLTIMDHTPINPTGNSYSQAFEVVQPTRFVFISGQVPDDDEGNTPPDFRNQCLLAWKNVARQLEDAGMTLNNLVKVTIFLFDRIYREENKEIRKEVLGDHEPALTIIITGIYEEKWLLEIEGVAAD